LIENWREKGRGSGMLKEEIDTVNIIFISGMELKI